MSFQKVLVANRGEIAVRVLRGAKNMGYGTVAVYSDADADALHVKTADEAVHIGASAVGESYLVIDNIIAAAKQTGANAIHPGYGFLSENAEFSDRCKKEGITFIGPSADSIELMGSKRLSKEHMLKAGVPCVPGSDPSITDDDQALIDAANDMGYPVMVKASAGGGGRGMRFVHSADDIENAIETARSEAEKAFGNGELIVEKAVIKPRHVEIQIFADSHGNVVHLGERDCSVQRRHQKLIEESPSPAVDEKLRTAMGKAAVQAAKSINYLGAGTVEFLLDHNGKDFYFLEMNTRLQVEHPVTELVTGTDLVQWQLLVAAGETLPLTQEQITFTGHAIEVRLCAEEPLDGFLPQTGKILDWTPATGSGIRIDHCLQQDGEISPFYDSMQGKLIAWGESREVARRRLLNALRDTRWFGVANNKDFLSEMLAHNDFASGNFNTAFIDQYFPAETLAERKPDALQQALAAIAITCDDGLKLQKTTGINNKLTGWHSSDVSASYFTLQWREQNTHLDIKQDRNGVFTVTQDDNEITIQAHHINQGCISFSHDELSGHIYYARDHETLWFEAPNAQGQMQTWNITDTTLAPPKGPEPGSDGRTIAPMDGSVIKVNVAIGDNVEPEQVLGVMEAMKMELSLSSKVSGKVIAVEVAAGDTVKQRQLIVQVEPNK